MTNGDTSSPPPKFQQDAVRAGIDFFEIIEDEILPIEEFLKTMNHKNICKNIEKRCWSDISLWSDPRRLASDNSDVRAVRGQADHQHLSRSRRLHDCIDDNGIFHGRELAA